MDSVIRNRRTALKPPQWPNSSPDCPSVESLENKCRGGPSEVGQVHDLTMTTIDSFAAQHDLEEFDLVRMGVKSREIEIHRSGLRTVRRHAPILLVEVHKGLLGRRQTCGLLRSLHDIGYEIKCDIPRDRDMPLTGKMADANETTIHQLIAVLTVGLAPDCFTVFCTNAKKQPGSGNSTMERPCRNWNACTTQRF